MTRSFLLLFSLLSLLLAACSALAPTPTATPVPTASATVRPTSTARPTMTPTAPKPTQDINALVPVGTPDKEWQDIPIMPGALAGADYADQYRFTVKATSAEIQNFYTEELAELGWSAPMTAAGKTGALLFIFSKDQKILSVAVMPFEGGFIVMLIK
jgi:hypothetical protein